jgi:hypothetical protein
MAYQHDIFISYRRNSETLKWINDHFVPLLEMRVELELGRKLHIYLDQQIESGTSWPAALGTALGESRILIPLWTRSYLSSVWCTAELSHMLMREEQEGLRKDPRPYGIIVPAIIHDGDRFPPDLKHIQYFEIQSLFNPRMARTSARAEMLDSILSDQAPAIANCIRQAPPWRSEWPQQAAEQFFRKFHQTVEEQHEVPRFTQ